MVEILNNEQKIYKSFLWRIYPVLTLFIIAPFIAEYLSGSLPVTNLIALIGIAPMYGFGCILIRELVRQTGRGWPSIVAFGAAYGVVEEGIADMSLFNPNFLGYRLLDYGYIESLGMGSFLTTMIISLHTVWSICVPIGLVELIFYKRRTVPWLKKRGLILTAILYIAGITQVHLYFAKDFTAQPFQYGIAVVLSLLFTAIGFYLKPITEEKVSSGTTKSPWIFFAISFSCTSITFLLWMFGYTPLQLPAIVSVLIIIAMDFASLVYIFSSARKEGWSNLHRLALVSGPIITYSWVSFPKLIREQGTEILPIQCALITAFLVLLLFVYSRLKKEENQ